MVKTCGIYHTKLIELLAERMRPRYLELGIWRGETFLQVAHLCEIAVAVDTKRQIPDNGHFFEMTTTEFLQNHGPTLAPFDLVFIDADHSHEASLSDFLLVRPLMRINGLILLHDSFPESERFRDPGLCGDVCLTADLLAKRNRELAIEVVTLPIPPGVTIVRCLTEGANGWNSLF